MKTKLTISLVLLFLTVAFISKLPTAEEKSISYTQYQTGSSIPDNEFIIGALHNAYDQKNYYTNIKDTLHMNTWHKYTAPSGWGWLVCLTDSVDPADNWNGDTSKFGPNVRQSIQYNNTYGFRTIMDRPIIQYLTYGQRSDYQCEKIEGTSQDYWFYSYYNSVDNDSTINDTTDNSQFGDDQKVKLCLPSISSAGYIVKDLKANREQANKNWNSWTNDDIYAWYIKPRIRIDSNFAYNNRNDTVCRIDIIDWDGDVVKKVGILGKHFLYEDSYSGNYLMEYNFGPTDSNLSVDPGVRLCPGTAKDFWDWDNETIKTDFRVYWYGTCEMWIDYVRVENQPSVDLHSGIFDERIRREFKETLIDCNQNTQYFIKCKINNLPCIDYITRILRLNEAPNNFSLIVYKPFYNDSPNEQNIASLHLEH